jgi:hypothetical protein
MELTAAIASAGNPAIQRRLVWTGGFASPSLDGFALVRPRENLPARQGRHNRFTFRERRDLCFVSALRHIVARSTVVHRLQ